VGVAVGSALAWQSGSGSSPPRALPSLAAAAAAEARRSADATAAADLLRSAADSLSPTKPCAAPEPCPACACECPSCPECPALPPAVNDPVPECDAPAALGPTPRSGGPVKDCHPLDECERSAYVTLDLHQIFKPPVVPLHCSPGLTERDDNDPQVQAVYDGVRETFGRLAGLASPPELDTKIADLRLGLEMEEVTRVQRALEEAVAAPAAGSHERRLEASRIRAYLSPLHGFTVARVAKELRQGYCIVADLRMEEFLEKRILSVSEESDSPFVPYNTKGNRDLDTLNFLFEMAWESIGTFKRLYWLGVQNQQHPIDAMQIQDIVYTNKPDLIIETGTNNGGGALFFASILELVGDPNSRVFTVDLNDPKTGFGETRESPWENPLWKKRVTFVQGLSTDEKVLVEMRAAVAQATRVMVVLDSDHKTEIVRDELKAYADFVSVGQFCIVEDTRLDRMLSNEKPGPMKAVLEFIQERGDEFEVKRKVEVSTFSQHPHGYLYRKALPPMVEEVMEEAPAALPVMETGPIAAVEPIATEPDLFREVPAEEAVPAPKDGDLAALEAGLDELSTGI